MMESRGSVPARPPSYEGVWRFTAPAVDVSVPQARHAVRDLLARQAVPVHEDILQGLLLIVSELVTNAVKHAALLSPQIAVEVAIGAEWIRVSVEDNHPYRPKALEAEWGQTGGRGLLLVREIALEAGGACDVEHTATGGKIIWAALPLNPFVPGRAPAGPAGHGTAAHGTAAPGALPGSAQGIPGPAQGIPGPAQGVPGHLPGVGITSPRPDPSAP